MIVHGCIPSSLRGHFSFRQPFEHLLQLIESIDRNQTPSFVECLSSDGSPGTLHFKEDISQMIIVVIRVGVCSLHGRPQKHPLGRRRSFKAVIN
jgi:hypothetical protein